MTVTTTRRRRQRPQPTTRNGKKQVTKAEVPVEAFAAAVASEQELAQRAAELRAGAVALTSELFMQLWPLLREPIPDGFLVESSSGEGKPYESIGVRSVQVCTDRMDNVLSPLWWYQEVEYADDGKLCHVTVVVPVSDMDRPVVRDAWGGVDRGNTVGNRYKGSYTNAGKRAFALLGPGHEVWLGAPDFDPDVDPAAAQQQAGAERTAASDDIGQPIGPGKAMELYDAAAMLGLADKLQLAASHVVGDDVGDCSSRELAVVALAKLLPMQAARVEGWLNRKADELAANE